MKQRVNMIFEFFEYPVVGYNSANETEMIHYFMMEGQVHQPWRNFSQAKLKHKICDREENALHEMCEFFEIFRPQKNRVIQGFLPDLLGFGDFGQNLVIKLI